MNSDRTDVYKRKNDGTIMDKKTINSYGSIRGHYDKWEHNDKNNLLKVHRSILSGEKVDRYCSSRIYENDDNGNWIKQTAINSTSNNMRVVEPGFVFFG